MRKLFSLVLVWVAALAPAQAANVSVSLRADIGAYRTGPAVASCTLSVSAGADGAAVLDAAVAKGCIDSYETVSFDPYGDFVQCINDVCGTALTYWAMRENGACTSYGVSGFRAAAGDQLAFTYGTWLTTFPVQITDC